MSLNLWFANSKNTASQLLLIYFLIKNTDYILFCSSLLLLSEGKCDICFKISVRLFYMLVLSNQGIFEFCNLVMFASVVTIKHSICHLIAVIINFLHYSFIYSSFYQSYNIFSLRSIKEPRNNPLYKSS